TSPPGSDLVLLSNGDRSTGEIQQLDASFLEIKSGGNPVKIDRSRIRAIRFDPELTNVTRPTGKRVIVSLIDGSHLTAANLESINGSLKLKSAVLGNIDLPLTAIDSCYLFGERVVPVSDYEPAKIEFTPYLSSRWNFVRNANVLRGPLSVRGMQYVS